MSYEGINNAAEIFTLMQMTRLALLKGDKQDMMLGQMIEQGKEAMKHESIRITSEEKEE